MNPLYATYTVLVSGIIISTFPFFWLYSGLTGRYRRGLKERLGFLPQELAQHLAGSPRIWIHAVSLGEVRVAAPIVESLKKRLPTSSIIVSSTTDHGIDLARQTFGKEILVLYAPIDTIFSIRKASLKTEMLNESLFDELYRQHGLSGIANQYPSFVTQEFVDGFKRKGAAAPTVRKS